VGVGVCGVKGGGGGFAPGRRPSAGPGPGSPPPPPPTTPADPGDPRLRNQCSKEPMLFESSAISIGLRLPRLLQAQAIRVWAAPARLSESAPPGGPEPRSPSPHAAHPREWDHVGDQSIMYLCIYACMYVCLYVSMYVSIYVCFYTYVCINMRPAHLLTCQGLQPRPLLLHAMRAHPTRQRPPARQAGAGSGSRR
jgi:hypothetical protein